MARLNDPLTSTPLTQSKPKGLRASFGREGMVFMPKSSPFVRFQKGPARALSPRRGVRLLTHDSDVKPASSKNNLMSTSANPALQDDEKDDEWQDVEPENRSYATAFTGFSSFGGDATSQDDAPNPDATADQHFSHNISASASEMSSVLSPCVRTSGVAMRKELRRRLKWPSLMPQSPIMSAPILRSASRHNVSPTKFSSPLRHARNIQDVPSSFSEFELFAQQDTTRNDLQEEKASSRKKARLDPTLPLVLASYCQLAFNVVMMLLLTYGIWIFLRTISNDVDLKVEEYSMDILNEIDRCSQEYIRNNCQPGRRVPALETICTTWENCMNRDPKQVGRARVSAETFGEIIDSFLKPIGIKSMVFLVSAFAGSFVLVNAVFASRLGPGHFNQPKPMNSFNQNALTMPATPVPYVVGYTPRYSPRTPRYGRHYRH